jgi:hypothetical protein
MIKRIGMAVLVAAALAGANPAQAQEKSSGILVTADELKKMVEPALLISGRVVQAGEWFSQLFQRGGTAHFIYANDLGGGGHIQRTWRLDSDALCVKDPVMEERCYHLYRLADGSFEGRLVPEEQLRLTFRVVNPK